MRGPRGHKAKAAAFRQLLQPADRRGGRTTEDPRSAALPSLAGPAEGAAVSRGLEVRMPRAASPGPSRWVPLSFALSFLIALGCAGGPSASPAPAGPPPSLGAAAEPGSAEGAAAAAASGPDPQAMYADCRERVEGPGAAGECASDLDCAAAGCGGELCVAAATAAAGISTTCEQRPCFQALDRCACQAGQCSWTVKTSLPPLPPNARPMQLPPKGPDGRVLRAPAEPAPATPAPAPAPTPGP